MPNTISGRVCAQKELTQLRRAAFDRDGYVVLPSLLSQEELSCMRGESQRLLKRQRSLGAQVEQNGCIVEPLDPARLSDEQRTQMNEYRCASPVEPHTRIRCILTHTRTHDAFLTATAIYTIVLTVFYKLARSTSLTRDMCVQTMYIRDGPDVCAWRAGEQHWKQRLSQPSPRLAASCPWCALY